MKILGGLVRLFADGETIDRIEKEKAGSLGAADFRAVFVGRFRRFTIYNIFALAAVAVFVSTLFHPWWYASADNDLYTILGYPYILKHDLPSMVGKFVIETPRLAVAALICLLAGYVLLVFWGSTMPGIKGRLFVAFAGACMILYAAGFYGAVWYATNRVGLPVTGYTSLSFEILVDIHMGLLPHYHRAVWAGVACLLSSLLHGLLPIRFYRKQLVKS